jgi:glutathione S-transferase
VRRPDHDAAQPLRREGALGAGRLALPYREQAHMPLLHRLPTTRHGGRGVPVLLHQGTRLVDSTDILVHADAFCGGDRLYPRDAAQRHEVESLEERSTRRSVRTRGAGPMRSCCPSGSCCGG